MNIMVYLGAKEGNDPALKRAVQELGQWIGPVSYTHLALAGGQEEFMAAVMAGGMVPPLGVALAGTLFPERFTTKERHTAMTDYLMGACFITEGVVDVYKRQAWWCCLRRCRRTARRKNPWPAGPV